MADVKSFILLCFIISLCCTNVNFFKRLLDNETFFIENKIYFDQY